MRLYLYARFFMSLNACMRVCLSLYLKEDIQMYINAPCFVRRKLCNTSICRFVSERLPRMYVWISVVLSMLVGSNVAVEISSFLFLVTQSACIKLSIRASFPIRSIIFGYNSRWNLTSFCIIKCIIDLRPGPVVF